MPFCYNTRPLPGKQRYTGHPAYQGTRSSDFSVAAIAEDSGLTVAQVETVIRSLSKYVVDQSMNCWRIDPILGWFGFQGTCGGSHPESGFAPTFDNLAVDIRMRMGEFAEARARENFTAELKDHLGEVHPQIVSVTNMHTGTVGGYTAGKSIQVELVSGRGKVDPNDNTQGVFFTSATGVKTRSNDYGFTKGALIVCVVPAGLTGPQTLSVTMVMNGSPRTGALNVPLEPENSSTEEETKGKGRAGQRNGKDLALTS